MNDKPHYDHVIIGFASADEMLDKFLNAKQNNGFTGDFAAWYEKQDKRAKSNSLLDHPNLPAVSDDDLADEDPGVAVPSGKGPKPPALSTGAVPPAEDPKQLVLA